MELAYVPPIEISKHTSPSLGSLTKTENFFSASKKGKESEREKERELFGCDTIVAIRSLAECTWFIARIVKKEIRSLLHLLLFRWFIEVYTYLQGPAGESGV